MKRGFLLILGSVALAMVEAHAELGPGYPRAAQADPIQLQYLPGAGPPEDAGGRKRPLRVGGRPGAKSRPRGRAPALPNEFAGELDGDSSAVPGEAGVDYPIYSEVPVTSFSCEGRVAGYYADPETRCQTFHVCTPGGSTSNSFLCPNGTLFNPAVRTCDWWPAVDCGSSSDSLRLPQNTGKVKEKPLGPVAGSQTGSQTQRTDKRPPSAQVRRPLLNGAQHFQSTKREDSPYDQQTPQPTIPTRVADDREFARRPKPFSGSLRKQKQQVRVTTQVAPQNGHYDEGKIYSTDRIASPTTSRATQARWGKPTPRPQTVTRFDFTSETLEFPSMRTAPTRSTYNAKKTYQTHVEQSRPTIAPSTIPIFDRPSFTTRKQERLSQSQSSATSSPSAYTERRPYKASRLVTQAPFVTRQQFRNQPQSVKISATNQPRASYAEGYHNHLTSSGRPIHVTQEYPLDFSQTSLDRDQFFNLPERGGQPFIFSDTATTEAPVRDETLRPTVVTSPGRIHGSFAAVNDQSLVQPHSISSNVHDTSEKYKSFTTGKAVPFALSQGASIDSTGENVPVAFGITQSLLPTQNTVMETLFTTEERVPLVIGNTPTQGTFTKSNNANDEQGPLFSGYTNSYSPTQDIFVNPQQDTSSFTTGNTQSFTIAQETSTESQGNREKLKPNLLEITQSLTPTKSTFKLPQQISEGTGTLAIGSSQFPLTQSPDASKDFIDNKDKYNPVTLGNLHSPSKSTNLLETKHKNGPSTTETAQSFAQSSATSNNILDEKQTYNPVAALSEQSFSSSQAISSGSIDFEKRYRPLVSEFVNSFASADSFASNEDFGRPAIVSTTSSPSTSSNPSTPIAVSPQSFPSSQPTSSGSLNFDNKYRPSVFGFASADSFASNQELSRPSVVSTTTSTIPSSKPSTPISVSPQSFPSFQPTSSGSLNFDNKYTPSALGFANSFASADSFASNEDFGRPVIGSTTSSPSISFKPSTPIAVSPQPFPSSQPTSSGSLNFDNKYRPSVFGFASADSFASNQELSRPSVVSTTTSPSPSSKPSTPISVSPQSFPSFQPTSSGSLNFDNKYTPSALGFANSFASADSFASNEEFGRSAIVSTTTSPSISSQPSTPISVPPQSFPLSQPTPSGLFEFHNKYRPSVFGFANSFASADSFVSDEEFSRPAIASTTTSLGPMSTFTTPKPGRTDTTTTVRTTPTTTKLVYTPTVPQTTARPTSTTTPSSKKTTSIPTTTTFAPRTTTFVSNTIVYMPRPTTSTPQKTPYAPKFTPTDRHLVEITPTTIKPHSTTKKPKGFYITYAPPTKFTSPKQQVQKGEEPKSTYLPNASSASAAPTTSPTFSYRSSRPQIPESYFRFSQPTSTTTQSTTSIDYTPSVVKSVSHSFDVSGFNLNPQAKIEYRQPLYPTPYGLPLQSPLRDVNRSNSNRIVVAEAQVLNHTTTTEPAFLIQKSVELFASHEVAFHPSAFPQSSYSLSSVQDGYRKGGNDRPELHPSPFLVPSPAARGFGRWDTENEDDQLNKPKAT